MQIAQAYSPLCNSVLDRPLCFGRVNVVIRCCFQACLGLMRMGTLECRGPMREEGLTPGILAATESLPVERSAYVVCHRRP